MKNLMIMLVLVGGSFIAGMIREGLGITVSSEVYAIETGFIIIG